MWVESVNVGVVRRPPKIEMEDKRHFLISTFAFDQKSWNRKKKNQTKSQK